MIQNLIGVDVGGTKCAITYGKVGDQTVSIVDKERFATTNVNSTLSNIRAAIRAVMKRNNLSAVDVAAIGVNCGGPLDNKKGIIMSPPNLPGWDNIPIADMLSNEFGIKTVVENDANACALAEWKFGAGRGYNNIIFLTFGTGLGAGLILDGRLYSGTNGNAGEVGHIRLSDFGPVGYGKSGSFEGFCSGGGIAQLARTMVTEKLQIGQKVSFCPSQAELETITAQSVAEAALAGDPLAREIYAISGRYMGQGLSILIDILNPEIVILGSIYVRSGQLLEPHITQAIEVDSLAISASVCKIVPAMLNENVGDYAALSIATNAITNQPQPYEQI